MAFPTRMRLGNIPFRFLHDFFSTVQSLSIILDDSESVGREVLNELGYEETQINYLCDKYKRPVSEALLTWKGTVQDLYSVLERSDKREALLKLYAHLYENINNHPHTPRALNKEEWKTILHSTQYRISPTISQSQVFMRTYIIPICKRVRDFVYMLFPLNMIHASDMYRAMSNLMNNINIVIWCLSIVQNTWTIYSEGRFHNLVTIFISLSLWIKLYLMKERLHQLKQILPCGNDEQKLRKADFLYKEVRIALLFALYFKLALAVLGCILYYAFPQLLLKDLQSQMTQFVMLLFAFELVHNAFYLIAFYRDPSIFRIINDLFPIM